MVEQIFYGPADSVLNGGSDLAIGNALTDTNVHESLHNPSE